MKLALYCLALCLASFPAHAAISSKKVLENGTYSISCDTQEDWKHPFSVKIEGTFQVKSVRDESAHGHLKAEGSALARLDIEIRDGARDVYSEKSDALTGRYVVNIGTLDDDTDDNEVRLENRALDLKIAFYARNKVEVWISYKQREPHATGCVVKML